MLACGPSLIWAVSELEWRPDAQMGAGSAGYPPPPIRSKLMADVLGVTGLARRPEIVADALGKSLPGDVAVTLEADLAAVPSIATAQLKPDGDCKAIPSFLGLTRFAVADHKQKGAVETWIRRLESREERDSWFFPDLEALLNEAKRRTVAGDEQGLEVLRKQLLSTIVTSSDLTEPDRWRVAGRSSSS